MQATDVTRHPRITQQLVPSTTVLTFLCCSRFQCKKKLLMTFGMTLITEETRMQQALGKPRHTRPSAMGAVSLMLGNKTLK